LKTRAANGFKMQGSVSVALERDYCACYLTARRNGAKLRREMQSELREKTTRITKRCSIFFELLRYESETDKAVRNNKLKLPNLSSLAVDILAILYRVLGIRDGVVLE
jgi:hypothetical protein